VDEEFVQSVITTMDYVLNVQELLREGKRTESFINIFSEILRNIIVVNPKFLLHFLEN